MIEQGLELLICLPPCTSLALRMSNAIHISDLDSCRDDQPALNPSKLDKFPPDSRKRIEHLIQIQKDHDELKAQFYKERGALEAKYEKLYQPLYHKRYNIVNGIGVTTDSKSPTINQEVIPEFWLWAMGNFCEIGKTIKKYDEGALQHLEDIRWLRKDNLKGFKLEFYFRPNPFFKNSVLTLTYQMTDEDESIIEKITGTEIEWSSKSRRLKKHRTGNRRSFFNIFSPPEVHNDYKDLKLKYMMQEDYLIGSSIRDDIIPRAVLWFSGEAKLEQYIEVGSEHEDFFKSLSQDVRKRIDLLKRIQKDHDGLKAQFYKERAELEANYQKAYNNMYNERYEIVNGVVEAENLIKDSQVVHQEVDAEKGVPNFWLHALANHELLDAEISVRDGEALKYLTDIKWLGKDDFKGFILQFCFDKNPFFQNPFLTKTYEFLDQDGTILHKALGMEIEWYPEHCLTEDTKSFFNFFNPLQINRRALAELREEMQRDCYIGSTIRDEIIPRAVLWFLGVAVQGDKGIGFNESEDESDGDADDFSEDEESEYEDNEADDQ